MSVPAARELGGLPPATMLPPGLFALTEWERRAQHREACIAAVKRSGDYGVVAQHVARPVTPDPRQPEVSKRAWEKSVRQWRMDLKALAADAGATGVHEPLRVPWPSEPMYVDLPMSPACDVACVPAPDEPLRVPWPSERGRSRSPCGANGECSEEVWRRRSAHRAAGVAAVKRSADYISAAAGPRVPRPKTPDPTDRKLSKRAWERGVQQWRMDLKDVAALLPAASGATVVVDGGPGL